MYCRVRCSSQSIPNSHTRNSTDRQANSFKTYHNTIIIFLLSFHTSNTFLLQTAHVTLNSKPALLLGIYYKSYSRGDATQLFNCGINTRATGGGDAVSRGAVASSNLPRTTKAKLVFLRPADHRRAEIAQVDPEVLPAAELRTRARKLQERCPSARARAPRQKGAQPDHRIRRRQLDGVKLACARKAKAAR